MPVKFAGQSLIPAPLVSINATNLRRDDGRFRNEEYTYTLTGTIVNTDGSLDSPGASGLTGMQGIQAEQTRINNLFSVDYGLLEIISPQGSQYSYSTYAKPQSITFDQGVWVDRCSYTVTLNGQGLSSGYLPSLIESFSENWSATENENGTYTVSHQIEAKGALVINSSGAYMDGFLAARDWVRARSYSTTTGGVLTENVSGSGTSPLSSLVYPLPATANYWNRSTVENADRDRRSWSLTESFVYNPSGSFLEESSASVSSDGVNTNRLSIAINGSVLGFSDDIKNKTARYSNALNRYSTVVEPNLYTRASAYVPAGFVINPYVTSKQTTYEPDGSAVRYNIVYSAVSGGTLISGAVEESLSISDTGPTDVMAQIPVPGRSAGPVIQAMYTRTAPSRTVTVNATIASNLPVTSASLLARYLAKPDSSAIINILKPSTGYYYITQDSEEFNPIKGQYSRTVSWLIDASGTLPVGVPSGIQKNLP
jgi:hypothetical protein